MDGDQTLDCLDPCPLDPPPGPVGPTLALSKQGATVAVLSWSPGAHATASNVYRGTIGQPWVYNESCFAGGVSQSSCSDPDAPPSGQSFFYMVSAENSCG